MRATSSIRCLAVLLFGMLVTAGTAAQTGLPKYESKYYIIYSDLDKDAMREVVQRVTTMAEEYASRTKGFAGTISRKLPFYLFKRMDDYIAAGGMPGTAGVFTGDKLMAIAGEQTNDETWHVVQHEGFHQFVHAVVGGDIPIWVNEGLAEYFGHAIWTGDGYILGNVPSERLARIKLWMSRGHTISIKDMMSMPHALWNAQMSIVNYDQAWSMVYFLAHADGGKYQQALNDFLRDVSKGDNWERAWAKHFGRGVKEFEKKWTKYWTDMNVDDSAALLGRAKLATLNSFFARAFSQQQYFATPTEFFEAARDGKLKSHADDALPTNLLRSALSELENYGEWSLESRKGKTSLMLTLPSGEKLAGVFQVQTNRRVKSGSVALEQVRKPLKRR